VTIDLRNYQEPEKPKPADPPHPEGVATAAELLAVDLQSWTTASDARAWFAEDAKWRYHLMHRRMPRSETEALPAMNALINRARKVAARLPDPEREARDAERRADYERRRASDPVVILLNRIGELVTAWTSALAKIPKRFTDKLYAPVWIVGLRGAGWEVDRAKGDRVRTKNGGSWAPPLDFVLEATCPEGHRTPDMRRTASIQLIMMPTGWYQFDSENSTCKDCTIESVDRRIFSCPMCLDGEWDETHQPEHDRFVQWVVNGPDGPVLHGSRAPVAYLLRAIEEAIILANAQATVAHPEGASEAEMEAARAVVGAAPAPKAIEKATASPAWTKASMIAWLVAHGIPPDLSARQTWERVKGIEGHPPKNRIGEVQPRQADVADPPA
jgi:hypothetical protein